MSGWLKEMFEQKQKAATVKAFTLGEEADAVSYTHLTLPTTPYV